MYCRWWNGKVIFNLAFRWILFNFSFFLTTIFGLFISILLLHAMDCNVLPVRLHIYVLSHCAFVCSQILDGIVQLRFIAHANPFFSLPSKRSNNFFLSAVCSWYSLYRCIGSYSKMIHWNISIIFFYVWCLWKCVSGRNNDKKNNNRNVKQWWT